MAARMTVPVGLSATFTVTKKGNGAPIVGIVASALVAWHRGLVAANRRL